MNIRQSIRNWLSAPSVMKTSAVQALISMQRLGQAAWTPINYANLSKEGYQKNVVVYRAIGEVARAVGQLDWLLYRKERDGERGEVAAHPVLSLLYRPNPQQGKASFFEALVAYRLISGNGYVEAVPGARRNPVELYTHRPDRMTVVPGQSGPAGYDYTVNGVTKKFRGADVALLRHWKSFNPLHDWYGMSPLQASAMSVDIHNASSEWNKALLDNRAQPSGALKYTAKDGGPQQLGEEAYNALKAEINTMFSGAKNAGRPLLLDGGLDWVQMALSPQDMDYLNSRYATAREIAQAFGVPPMLLGIPGDNTYSNMQEARLALYEDTVLPLARDLRDELNAWLLPMYEDGESLTLDLDEDTIPALVLRRKDQWEKVQNADFLSLNEKRAALGYEAIDGGDVVLTPVTMVPIGESLEEDEAEQEDEEKRFAADLVYSGMPKDRAEKMARLAMVARGKTP